MYSVCTMKFASWWCCAKEHQSLATLTLHMNIVHYYPLASLVTCKIQITPKLTASLFTIILYNTNATLHKHPLCMYPCTFVDNTVPCMCYISGFVQFAGSKYCIVALPFCCELVKYGLIFHFYAESFLIVRFLHVLRQKCHEMLWNCSLNTSQFVCHSSHNCACCS